MQTTRLRPFSGHSQTFFCLEPMVPRHYHSITKGVDVSPRRSIRDHQEASSNDNTKGMLRAVLSAGALTLVEHSVRFPGSFIVFPPTALRAQLSPLTTSSKGKPARHFSRWLLQLTKRK